MADKSEIQEALGDIVAGKILYDEPMSRYASLCVGGNAGALVFVESEKELIQLVRCARRESPACRRRAGGAGPRQDRAAATRPPRAGGEFRACASRCSGYGWVRSRDRRRTAF